MIRQELKRPLNSTSSRALKLTIGLICAALSASVTHATLMKASTLSELVSRSDYVVRVKVRETEVRRVGGRHLSEHRLSLLALYYKRAGAPAPTDLTLQTLGGTLNGLSQRVAGSPSLQRGEELIALLSCGAQPTQSEAGHQSARCRLVGMGQGLWRATERRDEHGAPLWAPSLEGLRFQGGSQGGSEGGSEGEGLTPLSLSELLKRLAALQTTAPTQDAEQSLSPSLSEPTVQP